MDLYIKTKRLQVKVLLIITLLLSIISAKSYADTVSEAYIVTMDRQILLIDSTGKTKSSRSNKGFALDVSIGADGTLWALTTNAGNPGTGGNLLAYQNAGSTSWNYVKMEGVEAIALSADRDGSVWFIDGEANHIWNGKKNGHVTLQSKDDTHFMALSADASDKIWAISAKSVSHTGNHVFYRNYTSDNWRHAKGTAIDLSGFWMVTNQGQIVTNAPDSVTTRPFSSRDFARRISVGRSGRIWMISTEANPKQGGAILKRWDQMGNQDKNWVVIPNVGAMRVSAK